MRNPLVFSILLIISLPLFNCGGDDATSPEPPNNPPEITAVSANPDPVPLNLTTTLSVTATDADGDALSYEWQATAGTFPAGNTSAQVTWIPPETQAEYLISVAVSDGEVSVDTTILVEVTGAIYGLSGQIQNQSGQAATDLYVVITDSQSSVDSAATDASGNYSFSDLPEGAISMSLRSSEIIVHILPRYIEEDTTINLSDDLVVNLSVREFNTIFHDDGNDTGQWIMNGGVWNDGTKYIFEDQFLFDDYMVMQYVYTVPSNAQDIGFLLHGEAAPSGSSAILTWVWVNDDYAPFYWNSEFNTSPRYYWGSLEAISNLPGSATALYLEYNELTATYVYIDDIWIFNY